MFSLFETKRFFSNKDPIPDDLISFLLHQFTFASCSLSYISKTCRHFKTRIEKSTKKDEKSHILTSTLHYNML